MLLAIQIVLIKSGSEENKLAQNIFLKLKVTAGRKGTKLNVNHQFDLHTFPGLIKQ